MVNEEYKDIVLDCRSENFTSTCCRFVTHHDRHECLCSQLLSSVVQCIGVVNVVTIGVVENFTLEGVLFSSCDVVTGHKNYLLRVHTLFDQDLIRVESVSLMSVVVISATGCDNDSPVFSGHSRGYK